MAELAGLVLSAASLLTVIFTLTDETISLISDYNQFGSDAEKLRIRFSLEERRLKSLHAILFNPGTFPFIENSECLADHLPEDVLNDVYRMLHQLYRILNAFAAVKGTYGFDKLDTIGTGSRVGVGDTTSKALDRFNSQSSGGSSNLNQPQRTLSSPAFTGLIPTRTSSAFPAGATVSSSVEKKFMKNTSWFKKTIWSMHDKRKAETLIADFEGWNKRVRNLLEDIWWPLPVFSKVGNLSVMSGNKDVEELGLKDKVGLRRLIMNREDVDPRKLRISPAALQMGEKVGRFSVAQAGENSSETVLVEYKQYQYEEEAPNPQARSDSTSLSRLLHLTTLLNQQSDPSFRVFHCKGYVLPSDSTIGIIFTLPPQLSPKSMSLLEAIPTTKTVKSSGSAAGGTGAGIGRPNLGDRFKLAHALAESVHLLHTVGWVHKNLRSENVLFFPPAEEERRVDPASVGELGQKERVAGPNPGNSAPEAFQEEPVAQARSTPRDRPPPSRSNTLPKSSIPRINISSPYLFGFEYSRRTTDFSTRRYDDTYNHNIYRHPRRWGYPKDRFDKIHDIYALGVMLLEIGLWQRAESLLEGSSTGSSTGSSNNSKTVAGVGSSIREMDPENVRERYLKQAHARLGYIAGERYQKVVVMCLRGEFGSPIQTPSSSGSNTDGAWVEGDSVLDKEYRLNRSFREDIVEALEVLGKTV